MWHALPSKAIFCNSLMFVEPGFFLFSLSLTVTVHVEEITLAFTWCSIPVLFRFHFYSFVVTLFWPTRSFNNVKNCCLKILLTGCPQSPWQSRIEYVSENWTSSRCQVINVLNEKEGSPGSCNLCHKRDSVIWCCDCNMLSLCGPCDIDIHAKMPLHDRQFFLTFGCF